MSVKTRTENKPTSPDAGYLESLEQLNRQCSGNALLRLWQIIGSKKRGIPALIPVCSTSWWEGVKSGKYPAPVRLGERTTAWYYRDIQKILENAREPKTAEKGAEQ